MKGPPANPERRVSDDRREDPRRPRPGRRITDIVSVDGAHISVPAFAAYLGVPPQAVLDAIDAGSLTVDRFGSELRIRANDARSFVRARQTEV